MTGLELRASDVALFARPMSSMLGRVGVGVCELSREGRVVWLSPQAEKLLGTSLADATGLLLSDVVHADPTGSGYWPNAGRARLVPVRLVSPRADLVLVVEDPDHDGLLTQLKLNHAAVEGAANAIIITNHLSIIEYVNPAFTRMTGYSSAEALGQHSRLLKSGQHDAAFYQVLWATLRSGATWNGTFVNRRKDGTLFTEEATITPITGPDEVTHFVAVKRDVTIQRRLEALAARSERLGLIGELAVSLAHDLANILTPIVSGVEFLQSDLPSSEEDKRATIAEIEGSTRRATAMVGQLVDFARGGKGLRAPIKTALVLGAYAAQIATTLPARVTFEARLPEELPPLVVDSLQLYQVVLNLCVNAVDAMPNGGTLVLAAAPAEREGATFVELVVTDTGTGIGAEVLPHLFEPFFTTKPAGRGTGLGLATVKRVAEAHGGTVRVTSEPGRGSRFTVSLPAEPPAAPTPAKS